MKVSSTPSLQDDIRLLLVRDLNTLSRELDLFADVAAIWKSPDGITNPAGTLVQHVCGNLQHLVGHVLGGTDYVRDRPAEFADRSAARIELQNEIGRTIEVVNRTLTALAASRLDTPFPEAIGGVVPRTRLFLLHLCTHTAHHAGQMGYLRRIIESEVTSSHPVSVRALAPGTAPTPDAALAPGTAPTPEAARTPTPGTAPDA